MVMFKVEKENITIHIEGDERDITCEFAGILDAIKEDDRIFKYFVKGFLLQRLFEEGETENDKQSSHDRPIN